MITQLNPRVSYTHGDSPLAFPPERPVAETSASIGDPVVARIGSSARL